jgi:hypothetical protein
VKTSLDALSLKRQIVIARKTKNSLSFYPSDSDPHPSSSIIIIILINHQLHIPISRQSYKLGRNVNTQHYSTNLNRSMPDFRGKVIQRQSHPCSHQVVDKLMGWEENLHRAYKNFISL